MTDQKITIGLRVSVSGAMVRLSSAYPQVDSVELWIARKKGKKKSK